jgi:hypothetical protein
MEITALVKLSGEAMERGKGGTALALSEVR